MGGCKGRGLAPIMPAMVVSDSEREPRAIRRWLPFALGPALAAIAAIALPATVHGVDGDLLVTNAGRATAAIGLWMALWWLTDAVDVAVTALLPVALFPLAGAATFAEATTPYANDIIFLFLGGFLLSLAMQRWGLHRRIALHTVALVGTEPRRLLLGVMVATAMLSVWVSNTATALMMLPIATSLLALDERLPGNLHTAMMLGIAYASSIGGLGSIIGSPPNALAVSFVRETYHQTVSFADWLCLGLPLVAVLLPLTWVLLLVLHPLGRDPHAVTPATIDGELARLGPMKAGEWATLLVFLAAVMGWVLRPLLTRMTLFGHQPLAQLSDATIAMLAALVLFLVPVDRLRRQSVLDWSTAERLPWGVLILFGGGLSLANAVQRNGLGALLGASLAGLRDLPPSLVILAVITLVIFLTEITSNTATTATLVPLFAAMAPVLGVHPYALVFPTAIAASCAFMLPVATPPNAIVFATGFVSARAMRRAGIWLNLIGIVVIYLWATFLLPAVVPGGPLR